MSADLQRFEVEEPAQDNSTKARATAGIGRQAVLAISMLLVGFVLGACIFGGSGRRSSQRLPMDPQVIDWAQLGVEPFDVQITVEETPRASSRRLGADDPTAEMTKLAAELETLVPQKLKEKGIQVIAHLKDVEQRTVTLMVVLREKHTRDLLATKDHEAFNEAVQTLSKSLKGLNMFNRINHLDVDIRGKLRHKAMSRVPDILEEQLPGAVMRKVSVGVDPTPPDDGDGAELSSKVDTTVYIHTIVPADMIPADASHGDKPGSAIKAVANSIEGALPESLEEISGEAPNFHVDLLSEADLGNETERQSFWLKIHAKKIDFLGDVKVADSYRSLHEAIKSIEMLGSVKLGDVMKAIRDDLSSQLLPKLETKLVKSLSHKSGMTLKLTDEAGFKAFTKWEQQGRCCATKPSDGHALFWVAESQLVEGGCPKVKLSHECVALVYRPPLECSNVVAEVTGIYTYDVDNGLQTTAKTVEWIC